MTGQQFIHGNGPRPMFQLPSNHLQHLQTLSVQYFSFALVGNSTETEHPPPATAAVGNSISDPNSTNSTISTRRSRSNSGSSVLTAYAPVPLLSQLRSLQLKDFTTPDLQQLTYLSCATNLTSLRLSHIKDRAWAGLNPSTGSTLLSAIIPQLTALKNLSFNLTIQPPALASISNLQQLESLQLYLEPWTDFSSTLSTISTALTALQLNGPRSTRLFGPHALGSTVLCSSHTSLSWGCCSTWSSPSHTWTRLFSLFARSCSTWCSTRCT
jgi:hypothetical protein